MSKLYYAGERIVFVELTKDKHPFQVFTVHTDHYGPSWNMYDIEYSRRERTHVMSNCGNGRPHLQDRTARWWAEPGFDLSSVRVYGRVSGSPIPNLKPPPTQRVGDDFTIWKRGGRFRIADLADNVEVVDRLLYCIFCNDTFTAPEYGDVACPHVSWCETCGVWSEPQERCEHDSRKKYEDSKRRK